ncbi:MAG: SUMF1/EgtB/PvdO family nonheme iron enzyme [Deltaproteobacteria bacterium]|nr:SUMF1/EgtB/PvdO family nonheme iron enzyme [Deltaproteobacteria bacterium]
METLEIEFPCEKPTMIAITKRQTIQKPAILFILLFLLSACEVEPFCMVCGEGLVKTDSGGIEPEDASDDGAWIPDGEVSQCVPGAEEICNGFDDNCDGLVDDGFDLSSDPRHCGECNNACQFPNADAVCENGECVMTACYEDFADLDPEVEGCEYACPVFPLQGEQCNGLDDDCDGETDESDEIQPPEIPPCRTTPNTPCEGTRVVCDTRENGTNWYCDYSSDVEFDPAVENGIVDDETLCDGLDGDCDGVADDSFELLGKPCTRGQGKCTSRGEFVCADSMDEAICDAPDPTDGEAELCNGLDDDCDGETDEEGFGEMVLINDNYWIDAYEASRPTEQSGTYSCAVADRQPWVNVTWDEADSACKAAEKRLCTEEEWQTACEGAEKNSYPYGDTFDGDACNGKEYDPDCTGDNDDEVLPTGTAYGCPSKPATSKCVTPSGVYDLSGNVREWTGEQVSSDPLTYRIRGGSKDNVKVGLTCQFEFQLADHDFFLDNLGFRCCRDK